MGTDFTPAHAAACAAYLPPGSAVLAHYDHDMMLTLGDFPVALLAGKGRTGCGEVVDSGRLSPMGIDALNEWLAQEWEEV